MSSFLGGSNPAPQAEEEAQKEVVSSQLEIVAEEKVQKASVEDNSVADAPAADDSKKAGFIGSLFGGFMGGSNSQQKNDES